MAAFSNMLQVLSFDTISQLFTLAVQLIPFSLNTALDYPHLAGLARFTFLCTSLHNLFHCGSAHTPSSLLLLHLNTTSIYKEAECHVTRFTFILWKKFQKWYFSIPWTYQLQHSVNNSGAKTPCFFKWQDDSMLLYNVMQCYHVVKSWGITLKMKLIKVISDTNWDTNLQLRTTLHFCCTLLHLKILHGEIISLQHLQGIQIKPHMSSATINAEKCFVQKSPGNFKPLLKIKQEQQ